MANPRIPVIVFGDGPRMPSGLARIARDLTARLVGQADDLGIRVCQMGIDPPGGWHWQGWDFYGFQESPRGYGRAELELLCAELQRETGEIPIVLAITDPARLYDITRWIDDREPDSEEADGHLHADIWGYLPIDAENVNGQIGGPAAQAVASMDRVLAYGAYGARVLNATLLNAGTRQTFAVQHLPHGIEPIFRPQVPISHADEGFQRWLNSLPDDGILIGAVATNQPRKDLGLLISAVAHLHACGYLIALWLHTDVFTKAWDIGQLVQDLGLQPHQVLLTATGNGDYLLDEQLAARYCGSDLTIAPGLGEGFCYPIVESLACGTPVVHGKYAGGVELIPNPAWLVEPTAYRLESCYALKRPVFTPEDVADVVLEVRREYPKTPQTEAYCAGSVAHLHWQQVWPRWVSWVEQGLHARRVQTKVGV